MKFEKLPSLVVLFSIIILAGFTIMYTPEDAFSLRDLDRDSDGVLNGFDECPMIPETYNKFEDEDGCPDSVPEETVEYQFPDTDGDGFEDRTDDCPNHPETFNGYLDHDGCPERVPATFEADKDSDSDGVPDTYDACPTDKETINEFKDGDGCPDSLYPRSADSESSMAFSECGFGKAIVQRINSQETICINFETAKKWERYGIAEIISEPVIEEERPPFVPDVIDEPKQPLDFFLPPYPDQPEIHPNLIAGYDYSHPPEVHKVTEGVWVAVGYDLANSIMIEGDDGLIIVDTLSTYEAAKEVIAEFRKISDKPVKAIIYTHGHLDHVHGTGAFLEEGEDIEIFAHKSHVDFYINENSVLGQIASVRSGFASGAFLPTEGPDRLTMGVLAEMEPGTISYVPPTQTFSDELEVEISGVKLKMVFVAGESSDQIYIWLPEKEVLLIGDNIYAIVPNVYTLRGAVYRDPMNYVNALDKMIPLEAEYLVPSHVKPVIGKENVKDVLVSTRDATQYIYDQTIRGMNMGYTADELSHMIKLGDDLDNHPWLTKTRNQISSHVKQIYYGNLGWFEGDPAFLTPISMKEKSQKIVDGFGGIDSTLSQVRTAMENDEYEWAAELGAYAVNSDSDNEEAKHLKAHALRVLGQRSDSFDIRHWSLTEARVLEGKITIDPQAFTQTSPEQMAELPIDKIIRFLPTKLDPQKAAGVDTVLGVTYTDIGLDYTLHVRNSILAVTEGAPTSPDMILVLDSDTHKLIVGGHLGVLDAIDSGLAEFTGEENDLVEFLNLFDNLSIHTHGIG